MKQYIYGTVDTQKNSYRSIGQISAGDDLELELTIQMNSEPIVFINPECELLIKKSDNNRIRQTKDILYKDGKFKIKVDEQGVTYPGIVTCQMLTKENGRVSTCLFYFMVGASLEREVLQSISKVETLEQLDEYVVTAFSNLDEYETRLIELDATMKTTNEEITVNETERKANESERKINETIRVENEKERVKKENERSEAEIDRKENELDRIKNENARRIAENTRIARENARENAEINRNAIFEENEAIRNEAEKLREKAEAKRKENFSSLESLNEKLNVAEAERVKAEENREAKETERQLAEIARENAETNREKTYTNFNDAEVDRRNNENARIQAENLRVQEESIRAERFEAAQSTRETKFEEAQNTRDELFKASETARATEEIARERAESIREGNEVIRVNSESLRELAENTRQQEEIKRSQAEALRAEAEEQRVISYEEIKQDNINFKEEMNTDFGNAKTDYFGEEHLNVVDRLNSDFDNVHQRINDSSYLEYSGSNIRADNSYYGLTKEMSIKGRTLQNLVSMSMSKISNYSALSVESGYFKLQATGDWSMAYYMKSKTLLKPSTKYTILLEVKENTLNDGSFTLNQQQNTESCFNDQIGVIKAQITGVYKYVGTTSSDLDSCKYAMRTFLSTQATSGYILFKYMILEGDYTNTPIEELPFIDGIKSVAENEDNLIKYKSCGKNLIDINKFESTLKNEVKIDGDTITVTTLSNYNYSNVYIPLDINLIKGKTIYASCDELVSSANLPNNIFQLNFTRSNGTIDYFGLNVNKLSDKIQMPNDIIKCDARIYTNNTNNYNSFVTYSATVKNLQLTVSDTKQEYEPYQESIQELQLTEPLRSLPNGIADEVLEDGTEIKRVVEYVLNGSEPNWLANTDFNGTDVLFFYINTGDNTSILPKGAIKKNSGTVHCLCDTFPCYSLYNRVNNKNNNIESVIYSDSSNPLIQFFIKKSRLETEDRNGFKKWLQANPITVYYELAEPIITKHSQNMNLKTFDGTTHIISENYLPSTLSCKVPCDVQAVVTSLITENAELTNTISTMSLENEEQNLNNIETNVEQDVRLTMLELGVV